MPTSLRFLVTGGAGFTGSAVTRRLIAASPHSVCVVDKLTYAGNLASLAPVAADPRYRFEKADIADGERMWAIFADFDPYIVLHLAAKSHVDRSLDEPGAFVETNIVSFNVLLQEALRHWSGLEGPRREGFRFHHIATDEVFGSRGRPACSTRRRPIRRPRPIRPPRRLPIISCGPDIIPTACRRSSPTARTIMGPIIFRRS